MNQREGKTKRKGGVWLFMNALAVFNCFNEIFPFKLPVSGVGVWVSGKTRA